MIRSPSIDFLHSKLEKHIRLAESYSEIKGLSFASDIKPLATEDTVLRGVPVGMEDHISEIILEITPGDQISRISLEGTDGSDTEYRFSNQKENPRVPDQEFRFVPPPGFETIEGDFTQ